MGCLEVDVQDLQRRLELGPVVGKQLRHPAVSPSQREPLDGSGPAQGDPHAVVVPGVGSRLELSVGKDLEDGVCLVHTQLLEAGDVDPMPLQQLGQGDRVRRSGEEVRREEPDASDAQGDLLFRGAASRPARSPSSRSSSDWSWLRRASTSSASGLFGTWMGSP